VWALFGEKYGDDVRVVRVGDYSMELCGGTHVHHSGEIGSAYVASESGIGSGMRRVEVVAGPAALEWVESRLALLDRIAGTVGAPPDAAAERVAVAVNGLRVVAARVEASNADALGQTVDQLRKRLGPGVVVLGAVINGRPMFAAAASEEAWRAGIEAGALVGEGRRRQARLRPRRRQGRQPARRRARAGARARARPACLIRARIVRPVG
jgi:alanyl-tRNA synthetase